MGHSTRLAVRRGLTYVIKYALERSRVSSVYWERAGVEPWTALERKGGCTSHRARRLLKLLECCLMSRSLGLQLLSQLFNRPGITRHQGLQAARRGRLPFRGSETTRPAGLHVLHWSRLHVLHRSLLQVLHRSLLHVLHWNEPPPIVGEPPRMVGGPPPLVGEPPPTPLYGVAHPTIRDGSPNIRGGSPTIGGGSHTIGGG
jgi:hypothetical protein